MREQTAERQMTYSGLSLLFLNCTLSRSPRPSHTERLFERCCAPILKESGVRSKTLRPVDLPIAFGIMPDMREQGWETDAWPDLWPEVLAADILILGSPIWIGQQSSVATQVVERLYAHSSETNDKGQAIFYPRVGGVLVTGNEDGAKHVARNLTYCLHHIGFTVPPQGDAYWVGEAGPGPSYGDDGTGYDNDFTNMTARIMTWNLLHFAALLKERGGIPAQGNTME